jgi:hypothetical protein
MRALISRWILGTSLSIIVAAGGGLLGAVPASAQLINGLGQMDQTYNLCHFPTATDDRSCGDHDHDRGDKGRN